MTLTKEDLLAISQLLDEKLDSKLDEKLDSKLDERFAQAETRLDEKLGNRFAEMEVRLDGKLDERFAQAETRLDEKLDKRFADMEVRLDEKLDKHSAEMEARMEARFRPIEGRLKKVEFLLEHEVLPRLQTIEDCYLKTYKRYQNAVDQFDRMSVDIDALKTVVSRHSEKLNRLA